MLKTRESALKIALPIGSLVHYIHPVTNHIHVGKVIWVYTNGTAAISCRIERKPRILPQSDITLILSNAN